MEAARERAGAVWARARGGDAAALARVVGWADAARAEVDAVVGSVEAAAGWGHERGVLWAGTDAAVAAIDAAGDAARERVLRAGGEYVGLVGGGAVGCAEAVAGVGAAAGGGGRR